MVEDLHANERFFINVLVEENVKTSALLDSGASGLAYMSVAFARAHQAALPPRKKLPMPYHLSGYNDANDEIVDSYLSIDLAIGSPRRWHHEKLSVILVPNLKYDMLLGLPWFRRHNPSIHWKDCVVSLNSPDCQREGHLLSPLSVPFFLSLSSATAANEKPNLLGLASPPLKPFSIIRTPPPTITDQDAQISPDSPRSFSGALSGLRTPPGAPEDTEKSQSKTPAALPSKPSLIVADQRMSRPARCKPRIDQVNRRSDPHAPFTPHNTIFPLAPNVFYQEAQRPDATFFATSLRQLDKMIEDADPNNRRPFTVQVGNAIMSIDQVNVRDILPRQYHDFLDVFDRKAAEKLPPHRPFDHPIDLQKDADGREKMPPVHRPYSMTLPELEALRKYLDKELAKGFIRLSRSPVAAPVLFVKKANGDLRFCIDYRGLNAVTVKNRHALPLISETLALLSKAKYFTTLDVIAAFNKLRMKPGDEWKAAFTTRYGLFEPTVLPFGLCNGPASFQAYINHSLHGLLDRFCTAYMDDILIFSNTLKKHHRHVKEVLQRLREHGLQVDISKCHFDVQEVKYLGLIISDMGIMMDPAKVECIAQWPIPNNVKDVQSFLGFANFYRRFIPEFSRIAAPLTNLTRTKPVKRFAWNEDCTAAFFRLRQAFSEGTMLKHFDPSKQTVLETDASDYVTAAVLSQTDEDGLLRPVAFMSKKMLPAECNYDIYDKELLAIVNAFENWATELGSVEASTLVLSDHKNLEYFTTTKKLNRRQARWNELLAGYDFKIVFRPGKRGGKPDALTRIGADKPSNDNDPREAQQFQTIIKPSQILAPIEEAETLANPGVDDDWKHACQFDDLCCDIRRALLQENPPPSVHGIQLAECELDEDNDSFTFRRLKYVPPSLRMAVLCQHHDSPLSGHRGPAALYEAIHRTYWWPGNHKDAVKYAQGCESCQRNNPSTLRPYGYLQPLPAPQQSFRHLTLDFVGPLPESHGYRHILHVVDRLTKRVWVIPVKGMTARETATAIRDNVIRFAGLPDSIVSDQGRTFIDATWQEICRLLKIKHKLSTSYHPQTDGQTERMNKTLEVYLRHFVKYRQTDWDQHLTMAEYSMNSHVNASTGLSPFFASFGHHPRMDLQPVDLQKNLTRDQPAFVNTMAQLQRQCSEAITLAQAYQESYANRKRLPAPCYREGDLVFLSLKNVKTTRPTKKLDNLRAGPYKITAMKTPLVAKLDLPTTLAGIDNNFHVSLLRPALEGFPAQQQQQPPPVRIDYNPSTGTDEWEVEQILDKKISRGHAFYLVRWTGYTDPTWEPEDNLLGSADDLLQSFNSV